MTSATLQGNGPAKYPYYTIGHSNRSIGNFLELLSAVGSEVLADVRTVPRSRAQPQFNVDALSGALAGAGIQYKHFPELGGLRPRARDISSPLNGFWQNQSFHNYADYALGGEFQAGLLKLREAGRASICVIMCAEALWWRCHRRIIADYLLAAGENVLHILNRNKIERAELTSGAEIHPRGTITYPATSVHARNDRVALSS